MFGNFHDDIVGSLGLLAEMHEEREDFAAARKARQEALTITTKLFGPLHWRTVNGTAKAGEDFVAASGTLTVPAGHLSGSVPVTIKGEREKERTEYFGIVLSDSCVRYIAPASAGKDAGRTLHTNRSVRQPLPAALVSIPRWTP